MTDPKYRALHAALSADLKASAALTDAQQEISRARGIMEAASQCVEWGVVTKPIEEHVEDFRCSLNWPTNAGNRLHGVYLSGTETVVCHTGNGPTSEANAIAITFALNNLGKLLDELEQSRALVTELRALAERMQNSPHPWGHEGWMFEIRSLLSAHGKQK